jgi:hypothetical protein
VPVLDAGGAGKGMGRGGASHYIAAEVEHSTARSWLASFLGWRWAGLVWLDDLAWQAILQVVCCASQADNLAGSSG